MLSNCQESAFPEGFCAMHLEARPELSRRYGYPGALGLMGLSAAGWLFHKQGWIV